MLTQLGHSIRPIETKFISYLGIRSGCWMTCVFPTSWVSPVNSDRYLAE